MKLWKKVMLGLAGLLVCTCLAIICWSIGEDLLRWLPLWLSKFVIGAVFYGIAVIVILIFVLGVVKIKEIGGS